MHKRRFLALFMAAGLAPQVVRVARNLILKALHTHLATTQKVGPSRVLKVRLGSPRFSRLMNRLSRSSFAHLMPLF